MELKAIHIIQKAMTIFSYLLRRLNDNDTLQHQTDVVDEVTQSPVCHKCGAKLCENAKFYVNCGAAIEKISYCSQCGSKLEMGDKFCPNCGTACR